MPRGLKQHREDLCAARVSVTFNECRPQWSKWAVICTLTERVMRQHRTLGQIMEHVLGAPRHVKGNDRGSPFIFGQNSCASFFHRFLDRKRSRKENKYKT